MADETMSVRLAIPGRLRSSLVYRGSGWGLADQAVLSGSSFVAMVLVARVVSVRAFGEFVLVYTVLLILNHLQGAVITQPHNILGVRRSGRRYIDYTSSALVLQVGFVVATATAALVAGLAAGLMHWHVAPLILSLAPAIVGTQLLEFTRRVFYTEERIDDAFRVDLLGYGGFILALMVMWQTRTLDGSVALLALSATTVVAAGWGAWQIHGSLRRTFDWGVLGENWSFGKWIAAGRVSFWLSSYVYLYLAAVILGPDASGILKASQIILGPLNVLLLFLDVVMPIRFSRALVDGNGQLRDAVKKAYVVTAPPVLAYCLVAAILATPILTHLYGAKYEEYGEVVVLYSAYYVLSYGAQILASALYAQGNTRSVFVAQAAAAIPALGIGWLLMAEIGVAGATVGLLISIVITALLLAISFASQERSRRPAGHVTARVP
jgi:O-antigen/teichoic acid export membrane protein